MQERKLLVEEAAKPLKLLGVAQGFRANGLVELPRERVIAKRFRRVEHRCVGTMRWGLGLACPILLAGFVLPLREFGGVAGLAALR